MLDLAVHAKESTSPLSEIASRQGVSEKYLWQVVLPLRAAGVVESVRGAQGGYRLARRPSAITIRQVLDILEGRWAPDSSDETVGDDRESGAVAAEMWKQLSGEWEAAAEKWTLEDMARKHSARRKAHVLMYEI